jgi:hypothetical protein
MSYLWDTAGLNLIQSANGSVSSIVYCMGRGKGVGRAVC